jgi:hypothetical protein
VGSWRTTLRMASTTFQMAEAGVQAVPTHQSKISYVLPATVGGRLLSDPDRIETGTKRGQTHSAGVGFSDLRTGPPAGCMAEILIVGFVSFLRCGGVVSVPWPRYWPVRAKLARVFLLQSAVVGGPIRRGPVDPRDWGGPTLVAPLGCRSCGKSSINFGSHYACISYPVSIIQQKVTISPENQKWT